MLRQPPVNGGDRQPAASSVKAVGVMCVSLRLLSVALVSFRRLMFQTRVRPKGTEKIAYQDHLQCNCSPRHVRCSNLQRALCSGGLTHGTCLIARAPGSHTAPCMHHAAEALAHDLALPTVNARW
jgi:hypothetical protein